MSEGVLRSIAASPRVFELVIGENGINSEECNLDDSGAYIVSLMGGLYYLSLGKECSELVKNKIGARGAEYISKLRKLVWLNLGTNVDNGVQNDIRNEGAHHIMKMPSLTWCNLGRSC